ncbi:MAG: GTP 3',8-cyclase MoaA [Porticoccaceae bacterium]|nr:GTP 3',8-cyclase MoaA [Porticoccaceae bacterium]
MDHSLPMQDNIILTDAYRRQFSYLRLSITDLCNFKCNYCLPDGYQGKSSQNELSLDEIKTLVSSFAELGFKKIRLTGGEPSLRKDLLKIIEICKSQLGIERVCITTNGYKLNQFLPEWIAAGIDQVNISIDSLSPEQFELITSSSDLPMIMAAIHSAIEDGFTAIKINTVLLREHLDSQVKPLIDWVKDKPIALRFIELMQTGENTELFNRQHVSANKIKSWLVAQAWNKKNRSIHSGPAIEYEHTNYLGSVGIIAPYSKNFCDSCNRLRVTAQGQLHLCLFSEDGKDLRPFLQAGDVAQLTQFLRASIYEKLPKHYLQQQQTGATRNFSMLGG